MKILVTGTKGQVSRCLQERATLHEDIELVAVGRPELDLLKPEAISEVVGSYKPDIVVSAAAYTAVDQAEDEPDIAFAVNEIGAGTVAAAARDAGAPVIHLSTDYVFSGEADRPYTEDDMPDPKCVYGTSKLAGERAVAAANDRYIILRTAWVYSPYGRNFVSTMTKSAETLNEISVVNDQVGNPTSAVDIADTILHLAGCILSRAGFSHFGIYNYAGKGSTSWAGFAEKIMDLAKAQGRPSATIRHIPSTSYVTKARRPANSRLGTAKLTREFGISILPWHYSLEKINMGYSNTE